jgi:acyl dehydratase
MDERTDHVPDVSLIGKQLGELSFPIDRSKLAELARSLFDDDPAYHDPEAARAAGFDGIPAPPTATVLIDHWDPDGIPGFVRALGLELERVLHGEVAWDYIAPLRAGDELTARRRVADVSRREGKRGGTMTLVAVETEFTNQRGELVVRRLDTIIEREG